MRRAPIIVIAPFLLLGVVAAGDRPSPDDEIAEVMPALEDLATRLDVAVALEQADVASAGADAIGALFETVEAAFARKDDGAGAAQLARASRGAAADVARAAKSRDFAAAATGVRSLVQSCRKCHETYRAS